MKPGKIQTQTLACRGMEGKHFLNRALSQIPTDI